MMDGCFKFVQKKRTIHTLPLHADKFFLGDEEVEPFLQMQASENEQVFFELKKNISFYAL